MMNFPHALKIPLIRTLCRLGFHVDYTRIRLSINRSGASCATVISHDNFAYDIVSRCARRPFPIEVSSVPAALN
jgi:hypothetical protein